MGARLTIVIIAITVLAAIVKKTMAKQAPVMDGGQVFNDDEEMGSVGEEWFSAEGTIERDETTFSDNDAREDIRYASETVNPVRYESEATPVSPVFDLRQAVIYQTLLTNNYTDLGKNIQ